MPKIKEIARIIKEDSKQMFKEMAEESAKETCPCGEYSSEVMVNKRCHICGDKHD